MLKKKSDIQSYLGIIKKNESVIQNFPEEKTSPDVFTDELYQYLKKQMIPILSKLFDRMGENCQFIQYIPDSKTRQ